MLTSQCTTLVPNFLTEYTRLPWDGIIDDDSQRTYAKKGTTLSIIIIGHLLDTII